MQNAACQAVMVDAGFSLHALQGLAAVFGNRNDLADIVGGACRRAFTQELHAPAPLQPFSPQAKQQGRIFLTQPSQNLHWRRRVGPRLGMRQRDLATVGEAGFLGGAGLPVDYRDLMSRLIQKPRGSGADNAATQYDNFHENFSSESGVFGKDK